MRLFSWFESTIDNTTVGSSSIEFNCINFSFSRKACLAGNGSTILGNQVLSSSQHVFTNFPNTNLLIFLFQQYFSVEKETNSLIFKKCIFFSVLSIWQNQNKCYMICGRKNSWSRFWKIRKNMS